MDMDSGPYLNEPGSGHSSFLLATMSTSPLATLNLPSVEDYQKRKVALISGSYMRPLIVKNQHQ